MFNKHYKGLVAAPDYQTEGHEDVIEEYYLLTDIKYDRLNTASRERATLAFFAVLDGQGLLVNNE